MFAKLPFSPCKVFQKLLLLSHDVFVTYLAHFACQFLTFDVLSSKMLFLFVFVLFSAQIVNCSDSSIASCELLLQGGTDNDDWFHKVDVRCVFSLSKFCCFFLCKFGSRVEAKNHGELQKLAVSQTLVHVTFANFLVI